MKSLPDEGPYQIQLLALCEMLLDSKNHFMIVASLAGDFKSKAQSLLSPSEFS